MVSWFVDSSPSANRRTRALYLWPVFRARRRLVLPYSRCSRLRGSRARAQDLHTVSQSGGALNLFVTAWFCLPPQNRPGSSFIENRRAEADDAREPYLRIIGDNEGGTVESRVHRLSSIRTLMKGKGRRGCIHSEFTATVCRRDRETRTRETPPPVRLNDSPGPSAIRCPRVPTSGELYRTVSLGKKTVFVPFGPSGQRTGEE